MMATPTPPAEQPDNWQTPQHILVVLAHPDDPEFFCGATLARWHAAGHSIAYALLTCGDKGSDDRSISGEELCALRHREQRAAADELGVGRIHWLDLPDGYLVPDLSLRQKIVRLIRLERPTILVGCDPTHLFVRDSYLNHPDHRAAGQAVVDAVFPAAGNHRYFPELLAEGLEPHRPNEVWLSLAAQPNVILDITEHWETKLRALLHHKSQIGDPEKFRERMTARRTEDSSDESPRYEERFRRIVF